MFLAKEAMVSRSDPGVSVMLVDDHDVVRGGLKRLLEAGDMHVVAEAQSEREAVELATKTKPDVILMDVRLGAGSGVTATREIRSHMPCTRVLMLTSFDDDEALAASILAGASGFILKEVRGADIVRSVRAVARGELLFDEEAARAAMDRLSRGKHFLGDRLALLSPQEEHVLEQIARGLTNREIAIELDLAEKTVKNYVSNVFMKLDVERRAEAAAYLTRHTAPAG
jgi:two-component system response regulator DevR